MKVRDTVNELESPFNRLSTCLISASVMEPWTRRVPPVVKALHTQDCIALRSVGLGHGAWCPGEGSGHGE